MSVPLGSYPVSQEKCYRFCLQTSAGCLGFKKTLHVIPALFCSFCNRAESLKEDDLEACEAVVLHQLRALLQSMLNGCLLPEKTLDAKGRAMDEKKTRYCRHKTCMWV